MDGHGNGASIRNSTWSPMSSKTSSQSDSEKVYFEEFLEDTNAASKDVSKNREKGSSPRKSKIEPRTQSALTKSSSLKPKRSEMSPRSQSQVSISPKSRTKNTGVWENVDKKVKKPSRQVSLTRKSNASSNDGSTNSSEGGQNSPDFGVYLLKQARDLITSGDNPHRALQLALRAAQSFKNSSKGEHTLDLVMTLHVVASIYCTLGQYNEAIPLLEQSIKIPCLHEGFQHYLAKFSSYMELGDTFAMLGQLKNSIQCYTKGLEVQTQALGGKDPTVGDSCHYLAEAYMQALQFDEAERLCIQALDIHRESGGTNSSEETADRRLLGLICDAKGDHEKALEHLVLASMALMSSGQEADVALIDCSIGDSYLSLGQYDQAVFAYQKALTMFKSTEGENHPSVASVFVRLAKLYNKMGKFKESRSYCENALRIYGRPHPGRHFEEIASGLTEVSAIYESMKEPGQALKLLEKALSICYEASLQQSLIAAIEAQMGTLYYITEDYVESYCSFKHAIEKLRACLEKKSAFFGKVLNQMGLACVQCNTIDQAAEYFEEARSILEQEYGPYHPDTLGVCSNLAGAYDAMGRFDEAIEILDHVVKMREEKVGTANPEVDDEKRRLKVLLKNAGRVRHARTKSLEELLEIKFHFKFNN